jgi:hypothetical protein
MSIKLIVALAGLARDKHAERILQMGVLLKN